MAVRANLIDLNPGGYHYSDHANNAPPSLFQLIGAESRNEISFFDEAQPKGWVSQYGVLNSGTSFLSDLVSGEPLTMSEVAWDFLGTPYGMRYLDVVGFQNGDIWESVYLVTGATRFDSDGWLQTLLNGNATITSISFYGTTPDNATPDGGTTLLMFGIGLLGLLCFKMKRLSC